MEREEIRRLCLNVWASPAVSPGGAPPRPLQNSAKPAIDTREELAKIAGVSHDTIARGELALKRKHIIAAKAKKNQACGQGGVLLSQNSVKASEKIDTQKELAKIAGVSHDTIARVHGSGRCTLPFRGGNIKGRPAGGGPGFFPGRPARVGLGSGIRARCAGG